MNRPHHTLALRERCRCGRLLAGGTHALCEPCGVQPAPWVRNPKLRRVAPKPLLAQRISPSCSTRTLVGAEALQRSAGPPTVEPTAREATSPAGRPAGHVEVTSEYVFDLPGEARAVAAVDQRTQRWAWVTAVTAMGAAASFGVLSAL